MLAHSLIRSALFLMLTFLLSAIFLAIIVVNYWHYYFYWFILVQLAYYSFLVIMLVQLTKNQVIQYLFNPTDEQTPTFEAVTAVLGFSAIVFFIYVIFLTT